jgi:hypothetical protein
MSAPRTGSVHTLKPIGLLDVADKRVTQHAGHTVEVVQPGQGCPRNGTMGMAYVDCQTCADADGHRVFVGLVNISSLAVTVAVLPRDPANPRDCEFYRVQGRHAWDAELGECAECGLPEDQGAVRPRPTATRENIMTTTAPTIIPRVTVLHGHVSQDTAYLIADYPYGRQLRCQMRVWIEQAAKGAAKGQYRVMRQTSNPKVTRPDGSHPWNKPHASTYSDWLVLYLDGIDHDGAGTQHVEVHAGSLTYGLSGAGDARMRLDGTYDQLTDSERRVYDFMAKAGQLHDRWDGWHAAVAFITGWYAEHGEYPSAEEVSQAPGFYLSEYDYPMAVAEAASRGSQHPEES